MQTSRSALNNATKGETKMTKIQYPILTNAQCHALQEFAEANGKQWKRLLIQDWNSENPQYSGELRQIRNEFGPKWLKSMRTLDEFRHAA
jgi:hypothetical protein